MCLTVKAKEPDQIAVILTNWSNKGFTYKLNIQVYNESFTSCMNVNNS